MVLGSRTKNRRSPSVQVDYLIHIQEIKPWPPSQSLRSLRSVLIQWEHGERNSGSIDPVVPSLVSGSGDGDGKIEFNQSFTLPVTLLRRLSVKRGGGDTFQKNCLEFNLYEPRRDKTVKGQLLGTAIIDLADYGIVKENISISAPMNCKRTFTNTAQPVLFVKVQRVERIRIGSLSRDSLSREASMNRNCGESISALMNEEYAEEAETASFTDDDVSSHSSRAISSSAIEENGGTSPQEEVNGYAMKGSSGEGKDQHVLASMKSLEKSDINPMKQNGGSPKESSRCSSSTDLSSDLESPDNFHPTSKFHGPSLTLPRDLLAHSIQSSSSSTECEGTDEELNTNRGRDDQDELKRDIQEMVHRDRKEISSNAEESTKESISSDSLAVVPSLITEPQVNNKLDSAKIVKSQSSEVDEESWSSIKEGMRDPPSGNVFENGSLGDNNRGIRQESGQEMQIIEERRVYLEDESLNRFSQDDSRNQVPLEDESLNRFSQGDTRNQVPLGSEAPCFTKGSPGVKDDARSGDGPKHVKSVRSPMDSGRSSGSVRSNQIAEKVKDVVLKDEQNGARTAISNRRNDAKVYLNETRNIFSESKVQQLEHRIKMLEGELREAAAVEFSLYSVVAEHGSSINKVHAPARRLSRLYLHAYKGNSQSGRASAARTAVSGLVLVTKACGNDVPRLTFWLSNSVALRAIISQDFDVKHLTVSAGPFVEKAGVVKGYKKKSCPLKWKEYSSINETGIALCNRIDDWEDPRTFTSALEKFEAWIFSRIVDSIWWQTLTPYMQSAAAKATAAVTDSSSSKIYQMSSSSYDEEQGNFSLELWKKAFRDACERICPVRAGGHECGCFPVLSRLIMEKCLARLDVAMFNAILRESADEIPTDPISDPINDPKVLPIPAGTASFGAGAQLKNSIGNWSRWITDLFGIDDDDLLEDWNEPDDNGDDDDKRKDTFKVFHFLNALSDLMMLPKDMLLSRTIRKEVCPTFGTALIKRILNTFVPDEFCPDPIPRVVLEALDSEDLLETSEDSIIYIPCAAAPIIYMPPSAASVANILGDGGVQSQLTRSGSSVLRKSYTSDDELDELDSPIISIIGSAPAQRKPSQTSQGNGSQKAIRYQLLREVWLDSEF